MVSTTGEGSALGILLPSCVALILCLRTFRIAGAPLSWSANLD
jgi:hypothetical protein